jgi:predicted RNA-binding Zn-ribbon protein involved in translation (DUF1610 family)
MKVPKRKVGQRLMVGSSDRKRRRHLKVQGVRRDRNELVCPDCGSSALYRFGHVRGIHQRYVCRDCGRQFIPGRERTSVPGRPTCAICGAGTHLFKKNSANAVFRCARYPLCRTYVRIEGPFTGLPSGDALPFRAR